jgi:hypothetical protein
VGGDDSTSYGNDTSVNRRLPDIYRQQFVISALEDSDPIALGIYEHDRRLHGKRFLSTSQLAQKFKLSLASISNRRKRIFELENKAEQEIFGK